MNKFKLSEKIKLIFNLILIVFAIQSSFGQEKTYVFAENFMLDVKTESA
jgi:hypothetical protein